MALTTYFTELLAKVESSEEIGNNGKDENGFFRPNRTILIQKLNMLRDLHGNPGAKPMVRDAWKFVSEILPAEWLVLNEADKAELKKVLS